MKVLKWIGIILVSVIVIALIASLILPRKVHLERSVVINAPKEKVFNYLVHFEKFVTWSPWQDIDPNVEYDISDDGKAGAKYHWKGNDEVGEGEMTITKISGDTISVLLKFIKPFESTSHVYYVLDQSENGTKVTWGFDAKYGIPMNLFLALSGMKKALSADFEKGLAQLKERVESSQEEPFEVEIMEMEAKKYLAERKKISMEEIGPFLDAAFPALFQYARDHYLEISGPPTGIVFEWNEKEKMTDLAAAVPVNGDADLSDGNYEWIETEGGKVAVIDFFGSPEAVGPAHYYMDEFMARNNLKLRGPVMEEYLSDPATEPDSSLWKTRIIYPVE